jgi:LEA14-like dessication related protein
MRLPKRTLLFPVLLLFMISSCAVQAPEFMGSEGFKMEKMDGKEIRFTAGIKVKNPNWFGIKIKKSMLDVYVEDQLMGQVQLEKKVKLKAKRENSLTLPLKAILEDGAMITMMRYASKENVNVRIKGKVKGGIWIFSKKIEIDEKRQVSGRNLSPGGLMNIGQ